MTRTITLIDVFSGCGGMTEGFVNLSRGRFTPIWAIDNNKVAVASYNANFGPHGIHENIEKVLAEDQSIIPQADVVIGGPPCQGFSLLNKNRKADERKALWVYFLEVVKLSRASIFIMENVPQLLSSPEYPIIVKSAESAGFHVASAKICAADYGVPQTRIRAFIVGCKNRYPDWFAPKKTHSNSMTRVPTARPGYIDNAKPWVTVRNSIEDLPPPQTTLINELPCPLDLHFARKPTPNSMARYRAVPDEGMNRFDLQRRAPELTPECWKRKKSGGTDLFGRLWWDRPAFTIRTEFFKPEKGRYLHPEQHRPITHREAARLQSFPDSFVFLGSKTEIAKQIGNAVPPLLAARIADSVWTHFAI